MFLIPYFNCIWLSHRYACLNLAEVQGLREVKAEAYSYFNGQLHGNRVWTGLVWLCLSMTLRLHESGCQKIERNQKGSSPNILCLKSAEGSCLYTYGEYVTVLFMALESLSSSHYSTHPFSAEKWYMATQMILKGKWNCISNDCL